MVIPDIQYQLTNCSFVFGKETNTQISFCSFILSLFTSPNLFPIPNKFFLLNVHETASVGWHLEMLLRGDCSRIGNRAVLFILG